MYSNLSLKDMESCTSTGTGDESVSKRIKGLSSEIIFPRRGNYTVCEPNSQADLIT